jgi:MSHA biogenesis protein MshJ
MRQRFAKVVDSVDRLSLRERLFVFAAGLFIVGGLWEAVLAAPLAAREQIANDKVAMLQERLVALDETLTTTAAGISEGVPDQLERLRALRDRVAAGEEELRVFTTDLVDPVQMRLVLEELLRRQDGLELVSAVNLPAVALVGDESSDQDEPAAAVRAQDSDAPRLFRHSLVLTLKGNYLDCLHYLEAIERLPWRLYWTRVDFSVDEYPSNDVVLELTTLSLDEEWIGV